MESPAPSRSARTLTVCLLVERGTNTLFYNFDRSAAAVDLALQYANDVILSDYNITLHSYYSDIGSTCSLRNHIMTYAMDLMSVGVKCDVYIGPGCGSAAESLYDFTSAYRTLVIGCPAAGMGTSAPIGEYTFFSRISVTHLNTATILLQFLRQNRYTSPTVIQDQANSFYQQMSMIVKDYIQNEDPGIFGRTSFEEIRSTDLTNQRLELLLTSNSDTSRIFILLAPSDSVRQIMLAAYKMGYTTGDYLFWGVNLFPSATWGNFSFANNDSYDQAAKKAYETLLLVSITTVQDTTYQIFASDVKKLSERKYNYSYIDTDEVDIVTSHFYDSVIYYASMIKTLADAGSATFSGDELARLKRGYSFVSPINGRVTLTSVGDRLSSYVLQNFNPDSGRFEDFISYPAVGNSTVLGVLRWPGRVTLPPNEPRCGFLGNHPRCDYVMPRELLGAAIGLPLAMLLLASWTIAYYVRRYLAASTDPYWWRIFTSEVTIMGPTSKSTASSGIMASGVNTGDAGTVISVTKTEMSVASHYIVKRAMYDGVLVAARDLPQPLHRVKTTLGKNLLPLRRIQHPNLLKFIGIAVNDDNLCQIVVEELCMKGTLTRLLERDRFDLDWNFKSALMKDLTNGMTFLHSTSIISHGNLSSNTCLIDSNFVMKICDYGLDYFRVEADLRPLIDEDEEDRDFSELFWRAPELLRVMMPPAGTQAKGDMYSYAVILQQIIMRSPPFRSHDHNKNMLSDKELLLEVKKGTLPPLRPRKAGDNIVDHLIRSMEKHALDLEHEAEQRMKDFMDEKRRSDDILTQLLPPAVAAALSHGKEIMPETYPSTTVLFSDIDGFEELLAGLKVPVDTISIMNTLYATCDSVIERWDVYKVESVKDQLMVVSGLPTRNGILHAGEIASMSLALRREISSMKFEKAVDCQLKLRVGIHSGSCVAGVIGTKMPRYCLFGDTVNTSSRMESHGEAGKIQCSKATRDLLDKIGSYVLMLRGEITIKGKGNMETYWLVGKESL
ncbi:Atrial natriuretic peptide receptor 1 [Hypsibius exemplaris]|uniref:Guanylate cyclase n=1 Tax=Hypsibius exemplaris TaxID=2072580 RepID=A0A1W0WMH5_HYPEX|nr:Atrial natriuretic peptide receptor 1 [Hypsibius exemplaris]